MATPQQQCPQYKYTPSTRNFPPLAHCLRRGSVGETRHEFLSANTPAARSKQYVTQRNYSTTLTNWENNERCRSEYRRRTAERNSNRVAPQVTPSTRRLSLSSRPDRWSQDQGARTGPLPPQPRGVEGRSSQVARSSSRVLACALCMVVASESQRGATCQDAGIHETMASS